jgi:hypothetical protein
MKLFIRHSLTCKHAKDKNFNRCGCPVWSYNPSLPRGRQRYSAQTCDWNEAMKKASQTKPQIVGEEITIVRAVDLYLMKRSKRLANANAAPYADRWLLRDGSKNQPSLLQWAEKNDFQMLQDISSVDVERWRNTWTFREESYSMKVHNAIIKAFLLGA